MKSELQPCRWFSFFVLIICVNNLSMNDTISLYLCSSHSVAYCNFYAFSVSVIYFDYSAIHLCTRDREEIHWLKNYSTLCMFLLLCSSDFLLSLIIFFIPPLTFFFWFWTFLHFLCKGKAMLELWEYERIPFSAAALANGGQQEVWYICMVSCLWLFEGITLLWAARVLVLNSTHLRYETNDCRQ